MLFPDHLAVLRGGGDLATGVAYRLHHAGFPVAILELERPLTVRRTAALSTAVTAGRAQVEDVEARLVRSVEEAQQLVRTGMIPVLASPGLAPLAPSVVIDARMAKRNIDTTIDDAPLVIGIGPGFNAGEDCHAAIETMRGHHLGRVIWEGPTAANTGIPGMVGGQSGNRVLRAPTSGVVEWDAEIADIVGSGQRLGRIGEAPIVSSLDGVVRGLITPGTRVEAGIKIGDIDPRADPTACFEISDKALAIGGGAVEAVLTRLNR
jgi:xanthine dehydrogenase accessory factor